MLQPAQHWLFQVANICLFLSYLTTHILPLRLCIATGSLCFALWGGVVLDYSLDTIIWNSIFVLINLYQSALLLAAMFPIKFDPDREAMYRHFFAPGKYTLGRHEFRILTATHVTMRVKAPAAQPLTKNNSAVELVARGSSMGLARAASVASLDRDRVVAVPKNGLKPGAGEQTVLMCEMKTYKKGDLVVQVGDPVTSLILLLSGRMVVEKLRRGYSADSVPEAEQDPSSNDLTAAGWASLNHLRPYDFLSSPEWVARATERPAVFEVRMRVLSAEAKVFIWDSVALDSVLRAHPTIESCLNGVIGIDLARKVFTGNVERFAKPGSTTLEDASTTMREIRRPGAEIDEYDLYADGPAAAGSATHVDLLLTYTSLSPQDPPRTDTNIAAPSVWTNGEPQHAATESTFLPHPSRQALSNLASIALLANEGLHHAPSQPPLVVSGHAPGCRSTSGACKCGVRSPSATSGVVPNGAVQSSTADAAASSGHERSVSHSVRIHNDEEC